MGYYDENGGDTTKPIKGKEFRSSLFPERLAGFQRAEPFGAGTDK